jgi:hypothetical protein
VKHVNYVEIRFSDGTVFVWLVADDDADTIGQIETALVAIAGQPDRRNDLR